jgi:N-acetylglucosaminyl-diphospho-decaprenol L-rhamnosyltransferase
VGATLHATGAAGAAGEAGAAGAEEAGAEEAGAEEAAEETEAAGAEEAAAVVSAVVVTYRSAAHLPGLLPALAAATDEVVVVDNASDDGSAELAARLAPRAVVVRREANDGFAAGINAGVARSRGDLLLLCNPDVSLHPGAVDALVEAAGRHPGDVLGPLVRLPDGRVQPTRTGRPSLWTILGEQVLVGDSTTPGRWPARLWPRWGSYEHEVDGPLLSAVCLLVPRALWARAGPMDERFFMYWEEIDWQLRAHGHGARSILVPAAEVTHARSASTGVHDEVRARLFATSARRFVERWLPGWRGRAALALLAIGQLARAAVWSMPRMRGKPHASARRAQHLASLRGLRAGRRTARRVWVVEEFGRGGIARYAADVADLLAGGLDGDADLRVATTSGGPAPGLEAPHSVWFRTRGGSPLAKAATALGAIAALPWRVRRGDAVWIPLGVRPLFERVLAAALRARGVRLVATLHNRAPHGRGRPSRLVLGAARRAHHVVVHGEEVAAWARGSGLAVERLPFPPPREDAAGPAGVHTRASLGAGDDGALLVAMVGNLYRYKGTDVLLDAASVASAASAGERLRFVLAGQAQAGVDLEAEVARRGLGACTVLLDRYLEPGELVDVLEAADVIALPYRRIDHSGVGALAAARGVPAVASDLPALRELLGDGAVYVPAGDAERLAEVLVDLPGLLPGLRAAARARPGPDLTAPYQDFARRLLADP